MGRDVSYKIVKNDYVFQDHEKDDELPEDEFEDMLGSRNQWGGPFGFGVMFTRDEMIQELRKYVADSSNMDAHHFTFTLGAFGILIDEMRDNDCIIIHYC